MSSDNWTEAWIQRTELKNLTPEIWTENWVKITITKVLFRKSEFKNEYTFLNWINLCYFFEYSTRHFQFKIWLSSFFWCDILHVNKVLIQIVTRCVKFSFQFLKRCESFNSISCNLNKHKNCKRWRFHGVKRFREIFFRSNFSFKTWHLGKSSFEIWQVLKIQFRVWHVVKLWIPNLTLCIFFIPNISILSLFLRFWHKCPM